MLQPFQAVDLLGNEKGNILTVPFPVISDHCVAIENKTKPETSSENNNLINIK